MLEKLVDGMTVKHCALVGEPFMYPDIKEFLQLLHSENIYSFQAIAKLYMSVEATPAPRSVSRILTGLLVEVPHSLKELKKKSQRTVNRL